MRLDSKCDAKYDGKGYEIYWADLRRHLWETGFLALGLVDRTFARVVYFSEKMET